jgi:hypothetical protein
MSLCYSSGVHLWWDHVTEMICTKWRMSRKESKKTNFHKCVTDNNKMKTKATKIIVNSGKDGK